MTPLACPHCHGQTLYLPEYAGQVVACPHCGGHILMSLPEGFQAEVWGGSPTVAQSAPPTVSAPTVSAPAKAAFGESAPAKPRVHSSGYAAAAPRRSSLGPLVALVAVLGVGLLGVGLLVVVSVTYLLLGRSREVAIESPAETAVAAQAEPPTAAEVLAQYAPPASPPNVFPPISREPAEWPPPFADSPAASEPPIVRSMPAGPPVGFISGPQQAGPPVVEPARETVRALPRPQAAPPLQPEVVSPVASPTASLSAVVAHAELPTLASSAAELVTPLAAPEAAAVRLRLISTAADIPEKGALFTLRSPENPLTWEVSYTPDLGAESPQTVPLGAFQVSSESIAFQWREPFSDPEMRRQLKNCVLVIESDNATAHVALRRPIATSVVKLDLERDKQLQEFALADLPAKARIFAEIRGEGFPVESTGGALAKTLALGPDEEFKFERLPGAELGLRISADAEGLNLTVAPRFREKGSTVIPLSRPKLEATKKAMELAIAKTKSELEAKSREMADLQQAIRKLPTAPPGSPAAVARGIQLTKLEQSLKRTANRFSGLQRQLPAMEARLKAVPEVTTLINQLDGRELTVEIYADCGDYRLPLVITDRTLLPDMNQQQSRRDDSRASDRQLARMVTE